MKNNKTKNKNNKIKNKNNKIKNKNNKIKNKNNKTKNNKIKNKNNKTKNNKIKNKNNKTKNNKIKNKNNKTKNNKIKNKIKYGGGFFIESYNEYDIGDEISATNEEVVEYKNHTKKLFNFICKNLLMSFNTPFLQCLDNYQIKCLQLNDDFRLDNFKILNNGETLKEFIEYFTIEHVKEKYKDFIKYLYKKLWINKAYHGDCTNNNIIINISSDYKKFNFVLIDWKGTFGQSEYVTELFFHVCIDLFDLLYYYNDTFQIDPNFLMLINILEHVKNNEDKINNYTYNAIEDKINNFENLFIEIFINFTNFENLLNEISNILEINMNIFYESMFLNYSGYY